METESQMTEAGQTNPHSESLAVFSRSGGAPGGNLQDQIRLLPAVSVNTRQLDSVAALISTLGVKLPHEISVGSDWMRNNNTMPTLFHHEGAVEAAESDLYQRHQRTGKIQLFTSRNDGSI